VQRLERGNISIADPHAYGGKIDEESIDAALQIAADLGLQVAVRGSAHADLQVAGQELVFRTKRPDVDP
jgi:hypothetical protein